MNWIIHSLINIAKLFTIIGLFILSALALPILAGLFALGLLLGLLRDIEPRFLSSKQLTLRIPHIKLDYFLLLPTKLARIQHAWIQRDRSRF